MGKIAQGILGGVSGKVGAVVGASWKGINYIRSMPASVANPRTERQVNQRTKFTAVLGFLQANYDFIKVGYKFQQSKKSTFNAAMSYTLKNAITGTAPDFEVDYSLALVSRGKLAGSQDASAAPGTGEVTVTWTDNSAEGNARTDDKAMILVYNPARKESIAVIDAGATRADAAATVAVPLTYIGADLEAFIAFQAADGTAVSDSTYLGTLVVA